MRSGRGGQGAQAKPRARQRPPERGEVSESVAATLGLSRGSQGQTRRYGNKPTVVDGIQFASKKEAARYGDLVKAQQAGEIRSLEVHPRFPLFVHGQDCGTYVGDFAYLDGETGERVVEDVKSAATRTKDVYRLKRRLVWACYGLTIREV